MKRSSKLLIAATAVWTLAAFAACNSGSQNNNVAVNQNKPDNNTPANGALPPPTPIPPAVACGQTAPADRANMVQQSLTQHITQTGGKLNEELTALPTPKFAFRAIMFPPGPNPGDPAPDGLILVVGGSITGKTIFPALNSLVAPYMAQQKCVMGVVFVPRISDVPPSITVASLSALPSGFGWSGCDYPAVACPDGTCASSCSGAFGMLSASAPAPGGNANTASTTNTASAGNTASSANASGNSSPPANKP